LMEWVRIPLNYIYCRLHICFIFILFYFFSVEVEDGVKLKFSANGIGVNGLNDYKFNLDLYEEVDGEAIKTTKTDSRLDIFIPKIKPSFWPRLVTMAIFLLTKKF
jgi:hypothetical protein